MSGRLGFIVAGAVWGLLYYIPCFGRDIGDGSCPYLPVKANFDMNKYRGLWYEREKMFDLLGSTQKCVEIKYTDLGQGRTEVNTTGRLILYDHVTKTTIGDIRAMDKCQPARLGFKSEGMQTRSDYWILLTDYKKYSVVMTCRQIGGLKTLQFIEILTRKLKPLSAKKKKKINRILESYGINIYKFRETVQTNCPGRD